ncbi:hypothetical protein [Patulibacter defluvii]|nr:hypothetical protein [Patulibacter sp. DM4]
MATVDIDEAKTQLSRLVERALADDWDELPEDMARALGMID